MADELTPKRQAWFARLKRLTLKELRETLRDRRTIITLILMPLLVYPILSLVFRTILSSTLESALEGRKPTVLNIAVESAAETRKTIGFLSNMARQIDQLDRQNEEKSANQASDEEGVNSGDSAEASPNPTVESVAVLTAGARSLASSMPKFAKFSSHKWLELLDQSQSLSEVVLFNDVDFGVKLDFSQTNPERSLVGITVVRRNTQHSRQSADYFLEKLRLFNRAQIAQRLKIIGVESRDPIGINSVVVAVDPHAPQSTGSFSLASLIPLVLVLMTVTGAVYPAIDLTAGERERGTLETLMAAPVPKVSILLAKFFAVWTVAIFTALLNLVGMATTVWTFQFEKILLGPGGFSFLVIVKIFGLLVLFAAFFSALMLAVTSFARSFKEAQAYLIPIILLSMGPGLLAMNPNLSLAGVFSIVPMVNVLLLGRDVINQNVQLLPAATAIGSTALYALFAIQFASNRFGADDVLYASQGSLSELISRPKEIQSHFTLPAAMFGLALLLPINLVSIGALGRMAKVLESQYATWALLMMTFTFLSFFCVPWLIAMARHVRLSTGFASRLPRPAFWIPAALLGLFMWPILATFVDQWYQLTALFEGVEAASDRKDLLVELTKNQVIKFRQLPVVVVALAFSIVPAVCEEWFFRGMIMQTLLKTSKAWKAIVISAALFGFFHVLSQSAISMDRLLPTTLMGILLGYVCYRSKSIWPGVVLHMLHNGCLVFLGYFEPRLSKLSWFPAEGANMPVTWVIAAAVVSVLAVVVISRLKPNTQIADVGGLEV